MEVECADMERVPFDASIQFAFRIGPQGFIDEQRGNAQHQEHEQGSGCEPPPHSMQMHREVVVPAKTTNVVTSALS